MTQSDAIQCQLLKLLALQPDRLSSQRIKPELLSPVLAELFVAMRSCYIESGSATLSGAAMRPGLSDEAIKSAERIRLYGDPEISFDEAIAFLEDQHLRSSFSSACQKAYDRCHDRSAPIKDTICAMASSSAALLHDGSETLVDGSNFQAINSFIEWRNANPGKLMGTSTGFMRLDKIVNGWVAPRYNLIGARPSVGKTALVGDLVDGLCDEGEKVLVYSLEMPADDYRARLVAKKSGVSISAHRDSGLNRVEIKAVHEAQKAMKKWSWWINDSPEVTIDQIEAESAVLAGKHGRIHVFVDYLQLVNVTDKRMDRFEAVGMISNRLKKMSGRLRCSVTACAQLRRIETMFDKTLGRTVQKKPTLNDFRESGNLEQDADLAILLHRDHINDQEHGELIVAKQRNGRTHPGIALRYFPSTTTFKEEQ